MASHSLRLPGCREHHYPAQGQLYGDFLCGLWATACEALGVPAGQSSQMLRAGLPAWADERIGAAPIRPSYVADDGFLAEMSVNWAGRHPELRLLFDTLSDDDAAYTQSDATTGTHPARQIHDIFRSPSVRPSPAPLWHSIAWRPPSHVVHKTYYGLYEWPLPQRYAAVSEAMDLLGMRAAWDDARRWVEDVPGQREIEFFALDQAGQPGDRIKIYYRNHGASLEEMNRIASVALHHDAERAMAAYRVLTGDRTDAGNAALSCLAFRAGLNQAAECTTYLRLADLPNDRQAVDWTAALLRSVGVDPDPFRALVAALVPGSLDESRGVLSLVSHRAAGITTYLRFPVH